ncbi:DinB/UmuC family translesion DNA polymerase [Methylobacterium sp. Leaf399]|uniref:DinB/UmuC family translesion DNA polymerase n=1 Tax=Methylobacterium sp. Leaf399 TaxID=1736364 RepID=UPI0009EC93DE|nr:hypothetical protein [Methylobacterium sp. Leaf399]
MGRRARSLQVKPAPPHAGTKHLEQITRARSLTMPVESRESLAQISLGLLRDVFPLRRSVRLIGVSLSGLQHGAGEEPRQLGLAL